MSDENKVEILEDEKALVLNHDYDGIKELNHPLPRWWVGIFVLTVVFSIPYFIYYHMAGGPTLVQEYQADLEQVEMAKAEAMAKDGGFNPEAYNAFLAGGKAEEIGKAVYAAKCSACHAAQGQGLVGPNLTDNFWIHGNGSAKSIYEVIDKGVLDKGMPGWGEMVSKEELMAMVHLIHTWKGSNPPGAKAPQGTEYK